jgi:hypothetical protein
MKKTILAILVLLLLLSPARAQEPVIWLPTILKGHVPQCGGSEMPSYWYVIVPEATVNRCVNPSAETTGNFAAAGGGAMVRSSTYSRYGLWSFRITTAANNQGGDLTLSALANAIHYVTLRVRGTLPTYWDWSLDPAAEANGSTTLEIRQDGGGAGDFYVDGIQVEALSYWTTYVDGDQQGCEWNGAEHASTSTRSASSRAGGRQRDFEDIYYFDVGGQLGTGTAPQSVVMDEYAILPGGELNTVKVHPRPLTLTGVVRGTSYSDMHQKLNDIESVILPDAYPADENGWQPVRLRYTGSTAHKEIAVHYEAGMEGSVMATDVCYWQRMAIRFIAPDPYFYDYGGSGTGGAGEAALLDTNDSATFRLVAGRLRATGQWDELGPPGAPGTAVYNFINATIEDDTYVYYGGNFLNFDNQGNADYIVRYNKQTGAWSPLGTGTNGVVRALAIGPDGRLYVGGSFTTAGGGAVNYIAVWDPTTSTWAGIGPGPGLNNAVHALAFGLDGSLYAGGTFTDINGGPGGTYNYVIKWTGAAWAALGVGTDNVVDALAIGLNGDLYAGGGFANAGGVAASRVARWDGSNWFALGSGTNLTVLAIAIANDGTVYCGGDFITAGGVTVNRIAGWNGTSWFALGSGMNGQVGSLGIAPDDFLYASGTFTTAGGIAVADRIARWNGSTWAHLDADLPGGPSVYGLWIGEVDPVIESNYDLWVGFSTTGTGYFSGTATATNNGTAEVYPIFTFYRSGGTSATLETIRNETTGRELLFDYDLLDGERLTIDLRPTQQSIVSSMFGPRPDAILANSDMGSFTLQPGANQVTSFVKVAGAPTITAWIEWRTRYRDSTSLPTRACAWPTPTGARRFPPFSGSAPPASPTASAGLT